ncbi:SMI1/KNR4 family protein [Micromonospora radicis]|uniref:SMI1/KNR4 family protein n=1 Tax=Micromonospora radicis TaxID=1894971 RepID=A0A418MPG6_9ACTN|nr:SMI1/KNR4 family protein [Micromonospora radicis]
MDVGPARLGVRWVDVGPPVRAELVVMAHRADESPHHEVTLGETFPVGAETWRFTDLDMASADEWEVTVRRVDDVDEVPHPPTGHLAQPARLRPYGQLDGAQLDRVETLLGVRLPPDYRDWLRRSNGALPEVGHQVPGVPFTLTAERPLFGVHPQHPAFDLVHAQRVHRDPWLSRDRLVIARPSGGLLLVSAAGPDVDMVYFLHELDMIGPPGPPAEAVRVGKLQPLAWSTQELISRLVPLE